MALRSIVYEIRDVYPSTRGDQAMPKATSLCRQISSRAGLKPLTPEECAIFGYPFRRRVAPALPFLDHAAIAVEGRVK